MTDRKESEGEKPCGKAGDRPPTRATQLSVVPGRPTLEIRAGTTANLVDQTLQLIRGANIFNVGDNIAIVDNGRAVVLDVDGLAYWLGSRVQYFARSEKGTAELKDPPPRMLKELLALHDRRNLRALDAVIRAPVICADGHTVGRPGYDAPSHLYLCEEVVPTIPGHATVEDARRALALFAGPWSNFDCATRLDKSTLLAAALTAIERPALPTAPALGIDAPTQGTGKTFLAQCLCALAGDDDPAVMAHVSRESDDETRKRITTKLLEGVRSLIWDNVTGVLDSASFAAALTGRRWNDRLLGLNASLNVENRLLVCFTGNNLTLAGDLPRRVMIIRLDAGVENPATRKFDSNPLIAIQRDRLYLVQAGLTLIRAYLDSDAHAHDGAVPSSTTASFDAWDGLVRQTVAWIATTVAPGEYEDPGQALTNAIDADPELEALGDALEALANAMGERWFAAADVARRVTDINPALANPDDIALRDAMDGLQPGVRRWTPKSTGRVLAYRTGRIVEGRRLIKFTQNKRTQFRIEHMEDADARQGPSAPV